MRMLWIVLVAFGFTTAQAQSLKGSKASVNRMYKAALAEDLTFLRSLVEAERFADAKLLVRLRGNANYTVRTMTFPYVRPATKLFIERFSRQYRSACGHRLVVTSAVRPKNKQPRNASPKSVHPTGMAFDLRIPEESSCRKYLERNLLTLEKNKLLEVTRERRPPHYHVAVFPSRYQKYVAAKTKKPR